MKKPTLTGEFAKYGAKPVNARWACSAIAKDGSIVFSGWNHLLEPVGDGHWHYKDDLSTWHGNRPGNALLRKHLLQAHDENLLVHLIIVTAENPAAIIGCDDASVFRKTFSTRENLVGKVIRFDGDKFVIDFEEC